MGNNLRSWASKKDDWSGDIAVVVSGGASGKFAEELIQRVSGANTGRNVRVCTVKSGSRFFHKPDLHFTNPGNLRKGQLPRATVVLSRSSPYEFFPSKSGLSMFIDPARDCIAYSPSSASDFELSPDFTSVTRARGPGIMLESVFFTLQWLGVKDVHVIGWDIADISGANDIGCTDSLLNPRSSPQIKPTQGFSFYNGVLVGVARWVSGAIRYYAGFGAYSSPMMKGEAEIVSSVLQPIISHYAVQGLNINLYSDSPWVSPKTNHMTLGDFFSRT